MTPVASASASGFGLLIIGVLLLLVLWSCDVFARRRRR